MKKLAFLVLPMLMFMASCDAQNNEVSQNKVDNSQVEADTVQEVINDDVTVAQAQEMIKSDKVVIIDVRTPEEYEKGHLENATLINFFGEDFDQKIAELPKDQEYLVYCHSGNRSGKAVKKMEAAGFTKAHNMTGGWSAWSQHAE